MHVKFGKSVWTTLIASLIMGWLIMPVMAEEKQKAKTSKTKPAAEDKVAVVNGSIITHEELNRAMEPFRQQMAMQGQKVDDSQASKVRKNILEGLINRELLYQESQKDDIKIDEAKIDEQLVTLRQQFPDETTFKEELKKMNLTEEMLKKQIRSGMSIQQFIDDQFDKKVNVSDKDIKAYYDSHPDFFKQPEKVKASHILIKADAKADKAKKAEARKKLEGIQKKVEKGEDFGSLAKEFSEGPSSAKEGDLGYFGRGQMVKPFEDAAFALKSGEVSGIVETQFGYHLIKVIDKKAEGVTPYEEVKPRIEKYLKEEKVQAEVKLYVEKLKETAKIERFVQ